MTKNETILYMEIKRKGIRVLTENLGVVGMIRFFQQIEKGWGDYTKEREKWLGNPSMPTRVILFFLIGILSRWR